MSAKKIDNFYEYPPKTGSVKQLIILLHGLGSNGRDLISLAPYWASAVPNAQFISPDAPFACDMVPPGYPDAYQWFSLQNRDPKNMLEGARIAAPILKNFITAMLEKYKLSADQCALVGFSQGTMMSLSVAPYFKDKLAGVLGYSGALLWDEAQDKAAMHKLPIYLVHGEADDVVPLSAYTMAREKLEFEGFPVQGHTTRGLPHSIDERGISEGAKFLKSVFSS